MITATVFEYILPDYGHEWGRDGRLVEAETHAEAAEKAAERFCSEGVEWPPSLMIHVRSHEGGDPAGFVARFKVTVEQVPVFTAKQIKTGQP